jgi:hypothetical protein
LPPTNAECYFCKAKITGGLFAGELAKKAAALGLKGSVFPSVQKALEAAW